eukprot:3339658-Pyramimonas_sp.AAC.1
MNSVPGDVFMVAGDIEVIDGHSMLPLVGGGAIQVDCCRPAITMDFDLQHPIKVIEIDTKSKKYWHGQFNPDRFLDNRDMQLTYFRFTHRIRNRSFGPNYTAMSQVQDERCELVCFIDACRHI